MDNAAKGVRFAIFQAGSLAVCKPGQFRITLANETYTYDLPLPGC
jgi:hypothetical protein